MAVCVRPQARVLINYLLTYSQTNHLKVTLQTADALARDQFQWLFNLV